MVITELWIQTLNSIKSKLKTSEYTSWFSRLSFIDSNSLDIVLGVPTALVRDKFESQYKTLIEETLKEISGENYKVKIEIHKKDEAGQSAESKPKEKTETKTEPEPVKKETKESLMLNPAYTFESFVPGENSDFAYNAALAIAKNPGSIYNPCLLYGGVGLGKTHLLQSIGNYIQKNTKFKVMYVTAENFTNEFIQSINSKNQHQFQNKYRKVSVLLIDDIQFLQKKESTQNELFNTFNDLYETGRQIVFTCDRPVEELRDISDRLKSRFERGLNIDIQPPDYETRMAILKAKCKEKNFPVSLDVLDYIATNISSNVRALESCITKLIAYSTLLNKDISLGTAKEQLQQIINSNKNTSGITIDVIIRCVASYYGLRQEDIKGRGKSQGVVIPRQIAMYLARTLTDFSTTEIAAEFGGKNHTTVMYNVQKVESLIKADANDISTVIAKLSNQIKSEISH